ncbi:MAG: hypothetical protein J7L23_01715 [Candidatus Diapherotrites archaeon]|nr:hypothetical protein [Candidatus Diapherotrites archaeon]
MVEMDEEKLEETLSGLKITFRVDDHEEVASFHDLTPASRDNLKKAVKKVYDHWYDQNRAVTSSRLVRDLLRENSTANIIRISRKSFKSQKKNGREIGVNLVTALKDILPHLPLNITNHVKISSALPDNDFFNVPSGNKKMVYFIPPDELHDVFSPELEKRLKTMYKLDVDHLSKKKIYKKGLRLRKPREHLSAFVKSLPQESREAR